MSDNTKRVILSILGIAVLVVAVVGISFAIFSFTNNNAGANTIGTGTITMSYAEPTNGIELLDALPMSDDAGKVLTGTGNTFAFSVSTHAQGTITIPYEINITPLASTDSYWTDESKSPLSNNQVKIYLTKDGVDTVNPVLISTLAASTKRADSLILYSTSDAFTNGNGGVTTTSSYVMRIWIDSVVDMGDISDASYEYHMKVNVDSNVAPVSS